MPANRETLEAILKAMKADGETAKQKDVARLFTALATYAKKLSPEFDQKLSTQATSLLKQLRSLETSLTEKVEGSKSETSAALKKEIGALSKKIEAVTKSLGGIITPAYIGAALDAFRETLPPPPTIPKTIPESAEQVRDKLESLDGEERLDVSAIKGLKEFVIQHAPVIRQGFFGGGRPVHVPMVKVFTGDGSNKTFYLDKEPRDVYTAKGWGSDFPHILTQGNGFTINRKVLTIDDDTDAPSLGGRFVVEHYT